MKHLSLTLEPSSGSGADLHFGHTNILKHQPNRPFAQETLSLIQGNHDGSIRAYSNYFKTTAQILDLIVKPTACPFLSENLQLTLCHYPMVTWNKKPHGSIMLHGHCHGKLDEHNRLSNDLRFDVGIDGELASRAGGFILPSLSTNTQDKTIARKRGKG